MKKLASFINKLNKDKEFQSALVAATQTAVTKEEQISATTKFANEAGFEVSSDELQEYVESIQNATNSLSDDDLDKVAGGRGLFKPDDKVVEGVVVGVVVGAIIADAIVNDK